MCSWGCSMGEQVPLLPGGESRPDHTTGERDGLDRYYTPDSVARDLVGYLPPMRDAMVLEPSVGGGSWVRALRGLAEPPAFIIGLDIDPGAPGLGICDVKKVGDFIGTARMEGYDAVVGNPPYRVAEEHVRHALTLAPVVAFLLRLAFLEGAGRAVFWREHPASRVVVLSRRPSFTGSGTDSCAYGFFVWDEAHDGPTELEIC